MANTTFVTAYQKGHLNIAKKLTGSAGFMEDARALAVYRDGHDGDPKQIASVAVFECFRGNRAELHFGTAEGHALTPEMVQGVVMIAFHPKAFNLSRVIARVPDWNVPAICNLLKIGFQFEYRDRASVIGGNDGIVLSLDRDTITSSKAAAGPQTDEPPVKGD